MSILVEKVEKPKPKSVGDYVQMRIDLYKRKIEKNKERKLKSRAKERDPYFHAGIEECIKEDAAALEELIALQEWMNESQTKGVI